VAGFPSSSALQFALTQLDGESVRRSRDFEVVASTMTFFESVERIEVGPLSLGDLDRLFQAGLTHASSVRRCTNSTNRPVEILSTRSRSRRACSDPATT
jgi:hypothetical protein